MLYLFFSLVVLLPLFGGVGALAQRFAGFSIRGLAGKIFTGIFAVTIVFSVLAFFVPLAEWVETVTLITGFSLFFYFKVYRDFILFFRVQNIWFYFFLVLILFVGSGYPFILDHFGYYVPTVKWLAEIGIVQGISNLDLVLGQMSFWHILQAGFSHFTDPFMRLNAVILTTYLIYIFEKRFWAHLVLFPFFYLFVQSPSPDLPAIVLSLVVLQEILNKNTGYGWLFTLSVLAFSIKPTLVWLPVFTFFYTLCSTKISLLHLSGGILIAIVFIFKNIWTFGYPVFPVQIFDLGLKWKPHPDLLQISADMAMRKTFDMQFSATEIEGFRWGQIMTEWFTLPFPKGLINLLLLFSLLAFFVFCILKKQKIFWVLLIALMLKTTLVLAFSAQYRFFLDVFFVVAVVFFQSIFKKNRILLFNTVLSLFILLMISFPHFLQKALPDFRSGSFMTGFSVNQIVKPAYFRLEKFQNHQIGNLNFNIVEAYFYSFDTPLPAITPFFVQKYYEAGIFPQLKGATLKDGFVWKKLSEPDREKFVRIIRDMELDKYGR